MWTVTSAWTKPLKRTARYPASETALAAAPSSGCSAMSPFQKYSERFWREAKIDWATSADTLATLLSSNRRNFCSAESTVPQLLELLQLLTICEPAFLYEDVKLPHIAVKLCPLMFTRSKEFLPANNLENLWTVET